MNILVDTMGSDFGPKASANGAVDALDKISSNIILCGDEKLIIKELNKRDYDKSRITVVPTTEVVTNDDSPTRVIKQKPNSSMIVGLNMLKEDKADAMLSAGSTGALLTGATLIVNRIEGVIRPALAPIIAGLNGVVMIVDAGANANCKPENLVQFAIMGTIYMETAMGIKSPTVGLLNIGTEEHKGNELTKETYPLLKELKNINFVGNIEGADVPKGTANIAVCDGFSGNLTLKTMEGLGKVMSDYIKEEANKNIFTKIGALLLGKFEALKKKLDASEYGGAIYLGIEKPVIKCHGNSNALAFEKAIIQADKMIQNKTIDKIRQGIKENF